MRDTTNLATSLRRSRAILGQSSISPVGVLVIAGLLAPGLVGCERSRTPSPPAEHLALWSERPDPPVGRPLAVYVDVIDAPAGYLVVDSRDARVCSPSDAPDPGDAGSAATTDGGPPVCAFSQLIPNVEGTQRFVLLLEPLADVTAPLLVATLYDRHDVVVSAVFRRFYPAGATVDAGPDAPGDADTDAETTDGTPGDDASSPPDQDGGSTDGQDQTGGDR